MKTKAQVLVIDDGAVVGHSFDRVLSEKGYDVDTALSGEEGLEDLGINWEMAGSPVSINALGSLTADGINDTLDLRVSDLSNIVDPFEGTWSVQIRNGELEGGEGSKENPDVVLIASAKDYVDIAEGRTNAMLAMATGKFKLKGNIGLAMKLEKVFKKA